MDHESEVRIVAALLLSFGWDPAPAMKEASARVEAIRDEQQNQLLAAFDQQADELRIAVALLEELGPEHALEFRRRAYPALYPRTEQT